MNRKVVKWKSLLVGSWEGSCVLESNCQMRTLDSGIGTFPLPDSGNRSTGRYLCQPDSPEDPEPVLSLQPALSMAASIRAQTLEQEVPSSTDSQRSADSTIVHSVSDPLMTARGMRPLQSRLPKPASSGWRIITAFLLYGMTKEYMLQVNLPLRDKVPRMCTYSASGGSDSDSDLDCGHNGFGAGRGKLVKALKSAAAP
ncbi:PREDICTED: nck-associated protein 5-like, partial [Galeopterus variegatus]|uniref:Nck-associated protein 5-like n=1 Tax=Galeopterus variegatus TaxID=482537 RepID=A0ABM0SJ36_GALVR